MELLVGTFRSPQLFTLQFLPPSTLGVVKASQAFGGHSWLALSRNHNFLYATCWSSPPQVAAYKINADKSVTLLNTKPVKSLSGYVAYTDSHLYSVGGPTGEVFSISKDGSLGDLVQELLFREPHELEDGARKGVAHGNFGGLRHGSHSVDVSPNGRSLFIADIGHNCIWTFSIDSKAASPLTLGTKHVSPRVKDGPRHTWPHPNGRFLYSLQEHSSMVDVFEIAADGVTLEHVQGVKIIPADKEPEKYWADEVRLSTVSGDQPRFLYASTRGLEKETRGYVAVFELSSDGLIDGEAIDIMETATSGGLANAVEPAPAHSGHEYLALTDSEEGYVFVLAFDGKKLHELARTQLKDDKGQPVGCATAVWL